MLLRTEHKERNRAQLQAALNLGREKTFVSTALSRGKKRVKRQRYQRFSLFVCLSYCRTVRRDGKKFKLLRDINRPTQAIIHFSQTQLAPVNQSN